MYMKRSFGVNDNIERSFDRDNAPLEVTKFVDEMLNRPSMGKGQFWKLHEALVEYPCARSAQS